MVRPGGGQRCAATQAVAAWSPSTAATSPPQARTRYIAPNKQQKRKRRGAGRRPEAEREVMRMEKMTEACKKRLLKRLNEAWPLSDWRPVDVVERDERSWNVTYKHRVTGETETSGLLKSELTRAEANNRVKLPHGEKKTRANGKPKEQVEVHQEEVQVVNRGIDTLVLNAYYLDEQGEPTKRVLETDLLEALEIWKRRAQDEGEPVTTPWAFQGMALQMRPNGAGRGHWQWLLFSRLVTVAVSRGKWSGGIAQVRLSSEYLWSSGDLEKALDQVHTFLVGFLGDRLFLQVSEVHVCVDLANWKSIETLDYRRVFVSRSRKRVDHAEADWQIEPGEQLQAKDFSYGLVRTGLTFAARGSVSCAIYDKTRELKQSGKEWFEDVWLANGWDEESKVWRVEFRYRREALHELKQGEAFWGIENAYDLLARIPDLWAYAAGHVSGGSDGWLRLAVAQKDKTRSRWPTHPVWKLVQGAFSVACEMPENFEEIVRKRHEQHNVLKGIEATMGYATSLSAWVGGDLADSGADLSLFLHWLAVNGSGYLEEKGVSFGQEVVRKRLKMAKPDETNEEAVS